MYMHNLKQVSKSIPTIMRELYIRNDIAHVEFPTCTLYNQHRNVDLKQEDM